MDKLANVFVSALLISFASWLAGRSPKLAGFVVALPVSTMIVLPMSLAQHGDPEKTMTLARSIFAALPVTLLFFVPFLLARRLALGFWGAYGLGLGLLAAGYLVHRLVVRLF